jgi:hypothetical protein
MPADSTGPRAARCSQAELPAVAAWQPGLGAAAAALRAGAQAPGLAGAQASGLAGAQASGLAGAQRPSEREPWRPSSSGRRA